LTWTQKYQAKSTTLCAAWHTRPGSTDFSYLFKYAIIPTMDVNDPRVEENFAELATALAKMDDSGFISDFLHCLLTPAEVADIAARWALVKALKRKVPHREIAKDLGISLCKITRGSRVLKRPDSAFAGFFSSGE